jgi:aspartyl-tRNA(Asn)/glutamyl-tRNA(Gln) amidotransferase subunit A
VNALEYLGRLGRLNSLARRARPRFDEIDVIATPTLCLTPPVLADVSDTDAYLRVNRRIVRNTVAVNYLGLCAITLPVGLDKEGMPVGLQLIAPAWAEEKLLAIALAAERVLGTAKERLGTPPLLS